MRGLTASEAAGSLWRARPLAMQTSSSVGPDPGFRDAFLVLSQNPAMARTVAVASSSRSGSAALSRASWCGRAAVLHGATTLPSSGVGLLPMDATGVALESAPLAKYVPRERCSLRDRGSGCLRCGHRGGRFVRRTSREGNSHRRDCGSRDGWNEPPTLGGWLREPSRSARVAAGLLRFVGRRHWWTNARVTAGGSGVDADSLQLVIDWTGLDCDGSLIAKTRDDLTVRECLVPEKAFARVRPCCGRTGCGGLHVQREVSAHLHGAVPTGESPRWCRFLDPPPYCSSSTGLRRGNGAQMLRGTLDDTEERCGSVRQWKCHWRHSNLRSSSTKNDTSFCLASSTISPIPGVG